MSQQNEQYAYFFVNTPCEPEDITSRVGMSPSSSWSKGDRHPKTGLERKTSRWCLRSRLATQTFLEAHIADVLAQLDSNAEAFAAVSKEFGGSMQLVGYFHERYPGLFFEPSLVAGLAKYNLSVDFDFYHLWSDGRDES